MAKRIMSTILAIAVSDLYILIFKWLLAFFEKRQNHFREQDMLPPIKYPENFKKRVMVFTVLCVLFGAIFALNTPGGKATFLDLFMKQVSYGVGTLSLYAMAVTIVGKIKRIYYSAKYKDPFFYVRDIPDVEIREERIENPLFKNRGEEE